MSGTYTVPPYANVEDSYDVPIVIEDDPSTTYNNESFEHSFSTQRDSVGYTTSAGAGTSSGTEDSEAKGRHAREVSEEFLYGEYNHPNPLLANSAGQPLATPPPAASSGNPPPGGMHSNLPLDPSNTRRAVRINPVPISNAPRVMRRSSQSADSGSRALSSGPLQVPISQHPAISIQPASVPVITSGAIIPAATLAGSQTTVYLPLATGGMIPISLPASTLSQISNPSLVQPVSAQVPSMFGVPTSASAIPAGGPPGGGYPYSSGSGPPGGGPPYSGGPPRGASSTWHPPPNTGNYPQYPVYPGSGGNVLVALVGVVLEDQAVLVVQAVLVDQVVVVGVVLLSVRGHHIVLGKVNFQMLVFLVCPP
eukprot:jgi/Botrbrau1/18952/Bobra.0481s0001.1